MSQWEKLIDKILSGSPNLRFGDLEKALLKFGYNKYQPKGGSSHYIFRKNGVPPITIPKHGALKKAYIEAVRDIVQKYIDTEE